MYPASVHEALAETLSTERAITALTELALELWLPLAEDAVLQAAAPPPDPSAAADKQAQWTYLVDAVVVYGIGILAADAFDRAFTAMTGAPMVLGAAALPPLRFDMPGMPTQNALHARARATLARHTDVDPDAVEQRLGRLAPLRAFVDDHLDHIRGRVMDAVGRVFQRSRHVTEQSPDSEVRADVEEIFDPDAWRADAEEVGQTHATAALNAGMCEAARLAEATMVRTLDMVWTAILDTHTRVAHAEAAGQRQPIGATFTVGDEQLRFPGDPRGSIENTINCRCRLFAFFSDESSLLTAALRSFAFMQKHDQTPYVFGSQAPPQEYVMSADEVAKYGARLLAHLNGNPYFEPIDAEDFNWVEECGGLPKYIKRITKHLKQKGMAESHAIATAVNAAKKMCATGDVNFPGKQNVNPGSRAEACASVAAWEKLKACAARKRAENAITATETFRGEPAVSVYRSFTSVLAVIGTPTDDGRMFAPDIDLSFRDFPLPLKWCKQSSGGHLDAYTVGVIESAGIVGNEIIGKGYLLDTPEAREAAVQIEHGVTGPSVDLGDASWEMRDAMGNVITEEELWDNPDMAVVQTVLSAKMLSATLVATPAFGQTSIQLGEAVERGQSALVAAAALLAAPVERRTYPAEFFTDPGFTEPTLPHMTAEGRIQGHLAAWQVCHTGIQDSCVMAPRSQTDYAWFHTAPPVMTTDGKAKVGRLTVGCGHAGARLNAGATMAHYDNAGTCFALVHAGEDEHGIWFSGVVAPTATAEQIAAGLSAPLSGDWRSVGGNLELMAALAVNTPGFPIIASGATDEHDEPLALVASLGPCGGTDDQFTDEAYLVSVRKGGIEGVELARQIVTEWRSAERRDAEAERLIRAEADRQAQALIRTIV